MLGASPSLLLGLRKLNAEKGAGGVGPGRGGAGGRPGHNCTPLIPRCLRNFPGGSDGKISACSAGNTGSIPGLGRSPGEGNGNPLQFSCLEIPMDRGTWQATVHRIAELDTTE